MQNQIKEYRNHISTADKYFSNFPQSEINTKHFDNWSIKDILAHFNHWAEQEIDTINHLLKNTQSPWIEGIDQYNKEGIDKRKNIDYQTLLTTFRDLNNQIIAMYQQIPEEKWQQKMWNDREYTLKWFLKISIEHYQDEHLPEIEEVFNNLKDSNNR